MKKFLAELIGTFTLVLFGCGSAVFGQLFISGDAGTLSNPITIGAIGLCFGVPLLIMCYAIGPVSGCHINPAVSLGVFINGGMSFGEMIYYWIAQVIGGFIACFAIGAISQQWLQFGANQFQPGMLGGAFIGEIIFTAIFVFVILGTVSKTEWAGFAGIPIGLALGIINIIMIPIDGCSVNPARSIGPALLTGGMALSQLWVFILAPIIGGIIGAIVWRIFKHPQHQAAK
ncbi:MAG: aquaporin [Marinifilaceae bacterium]